MIDILIPVYGQQEMLEQCLAAIKANTPIEHRVVIADDHSPNMAGYLKGLESDCVVLHSKTNRGFPANVNRAVKAVSSDLFVLLNSDTKPCVGWLEALVREMDDPQVAVVGARLLYPREKPEMGNTIQHCGVARDWQGRPYHMWRGLPKNLPAALKRRELNCVTFACVLLRKSVWDELGGLDEQFVGGQFEDVDYCWAARKKGYKIVYTPDAVLWHYEHGSGEEFAQRTCEPNMLRLQRKWPGIGSDEYLFQDILGPEPTAMRDRLAQFLHEVRADSGAFDRPQRDPMLVAHGNKMAKADFRTLPARERDKVWLWADKLIERLTYGT